MGLTSFQATKGKSIKTKSYVNPTGESSTLQNTVERTNNKNLEGKCQNEVKHKDADRFDNN